MKVSMGCILFALLGSFSCAHAQHATSKMAVSASAMERAKMQQELQRYSGAGNPQPRDSEGCGAHACLCEGAKQCLQLIDSGKCKPESFKCVGPPPLCICEKGLKKALPLKSR